MMELITNTCFTLIGVIIGVAITTEPTPLAIELTPLARFIVTVVFLVLASTISVLKKLG